MIPLTAVVADLNSITKVLKYRDATRRTAHPLHFRDLSLSISMRA